MSLILTDENFEKEITDAKLPVVVDFFATWCHPCSALAPVLEKVAEEMKDKIILAKVNVDSAQMASQKHGVERIPTVILFKDGQPKGGFVGLAEEADIKKWISENI